MFSKIVLLALVIACVFAAPSMDVIPLEKQQPTVIPIVSQSDELEANGTYHFSYETGNGIKREEIAYEKVIPKAQGRSESSNEGGESDESDEIHVQRGSYSYTAPDGTVYTVRYIADENGFQPIGDHLPRVPGIAQDSNSAEKSGRSLKSHDSAQSASSPKLYEKAVPAPKESSQAEEISSISNAQTETVKTGEPIVSTESENVSVSTTESVSIPSQNAQAEPTTASSLEEIKLTSSTEASSSTESDSSTQTTSEIKQTDSSTTAVPEKETGSPLSVPALEQASTEGSGEQPSSTASVNEPTSTVSSGTEQPSSTASSSEQSTSTDLTNSQYTSTEAPQKFTTGSERITTNNPESTEDVSSTTASA